MRLYIAVSQCPQCKKPTLGYRREAKALSQAEIERKPFTVTCLGFEPKCKSHVALEGSKALKVFEMPWKEKSDLTARS